MPYGDHSIAYRLLAANTPTNEIIAAGSYARDSELGTVTFLDKSSIELRRFNNHQAFLANGWNVTPRPGG